jgi:Ca2+-binding RTX toxin-like protein
MAGNDSVNGGGGGDTIYGGTGNDTLSGSGSGGEIHHSEYKFINKIILALKPNLT